MSRRGKLTGALALIALGLTACTRETPSEIGGPLLPPGDVRTFELILEPSQFLVFDTAFSGYAHAFDSPVLVAARKFEGVTDANTLIRIGTKPTSIQVRNAAGAIVTDSLPKFTGGTLVLRVDTLRSTKAAVRLGLYRTGQDWDARSATWTMRIDTGGVHLPWTTPGGTRGPLLSSIRWTPGVDSLIMNVDSQTVAALTNAADTLRGVIIAIDSADVINGARVRIRGATLHLPTGSTIRPDTTITTDIGTTTTTFIFTPEPATVAANPRASGVPAWRTILAFREDFEDMTIPCPEAPAGCTLRLGDIHLNTAELLLRPTGSPAGFSPEDSIVVQARALLRTNNVPLARSPVGEVVGTFKATIAPSRFRNTDTGPEVALPVSSLVNSMLTDTTTSTSTIRPARHIALMTAPEGSTFGFASFRPGPRLRLILTASTEQR